MDIDKVNFPPKLLDILEAISEAHFVALDLELSGVPVRQFGSNRSGKQTLAQRYTEVKAAAERYTILQIGLTCVKEDVENGTYELKPYNINLSPVIEERLDIDREVSFHSGAVEFLNSVGFDFQTPFRWGVPYLSRDETALAKERAKIRSERDRDAFGDMKIKPEDVQAHELMRKVREEIGRWKATGASNPDVLIVGPRMISKGESRPPGDELSRFEKRLIHQLVRSEFPEFVTISKRGVINIVHLDQEREERIRRERRKEAESRIYQHTGMRWVIEALAGSSLANIDINSFAVHPETGEPIYVDMAELQARFGRSQFRTRNRPRVLVGHNCFLDLVYLYRTFIGPLPDTVEGFQAAIHGLFPTIVDTKYLATYNCGDISPMSTLQQTAEQLEHRQKPIIRTHERHGKYEQATAFHEAGYDSMLTAQIAIRLSAKLEAEGSYIDDDDEQGGGAGMDTETSGGVQLNTSQGSSSIGSAVDGVKDLLLAPIKALSVASQKVPAVQHSAQQQEDEPLDFDSLPTEADTNGPVRLEDVQAGIQTVSETTNRQPSQVMPRFSSDFWNVYGNNLRVFGTQENVCSLGG